MITLLHIIIVHHPENEFAVQASKTTNRVFGLTADDSTTPSPFASESIWNAVRLSTVTGVEQLRALQLPASERVLWIVLADYPMTMTGIWEEITKFIAEQIDDATVTSKVNNRRQLILFGSDDVIVRLPKKFRPYQAKNPAVLGESRMGPHRLALLALHRARLLLARDLEKEVSMKIFLSHAKMDGVFFADALHNALKQVPELEAWYDARDIGIGDHWKTELENNASSGVFVAIRTEHYCQRPICIEEFRWAMKQGVPIVVVDALLKPDIAPAPLPFASMPNVRIADGNTHRVLVTALREHVRMLLVETLIIEETSAAAPNLPPETWRVWPRFPGFQAIQELLKHHQGKKTPCCVVVAETNGPEMTAAKDLLQGMRSQLRIFTAETFAFHAIVMSAEHEELLVSGGAD